MDSKEAQLLSAKNAELERKLEQKTFKLKRKSQELKIQLAIERIRLTALAMKEPADMTEVCRVISEQLQLLKVKNLRNIQTVIIYESRGIFLNYEYYTVYNKSIITEINYRLDPDLVRFADNK